jgi:hypothetical protein
LAAVRRLQFVCNIVANKKGPLFADPIETSGKVFLLYAAAGSRQQLQDFLGVLAFCCLAT